MKILTQMFEMTEPALLSTMVIKPTTIMSAKPIPKFPRMSSLLRRKAASPLSFSMTMTCPESNQQSQR